MRRFGWAIVLLAVVGRAEAQGALDVDPERVALDRAALDAIEQSRGKTVAVDVGTPMGRFLRTFAMASGDQVTITDDLVERARAVNGYFSKSRYFQGQQILATDTATGWITHRATIKGVLSNDAYRVEVVEVLEWNGNMSPKRVRKVERVISHDEVARLNDPTRLVEGRSYHGIRYEPVEDPLLRKAIAEANEIVDRNFPDFRESSGEIIKQQRRLFLALNTVAKTMEHSLGATSPAARARYDADMRKMATDSFYGSRQGWAGAYLLSGWGVCTEQAAVQIEIINSVARRAGINLMLVRGTTLAENNAHGFSAARFRADPKGYITDPSWEDVGWRRGSLDHYRGNLLFEMEEAMGAAGYNRNRRIVEVEGEQHRTPPPSRGGAFDRATLARRARSEAAGTGQFVAAYLLKEGFVAMEARDVGRMKEAVGSLAGWRFWRDLGAFTVAARLTDIGMGKIPMGGMARALTRGVVPLAAGMAAVQLIHGRVSPKDLGIDTGSFLVTGVAVNAVGGVLLRAIPAGRLAVGAANVLKLALTLYGGEKLGDWLRGRLQKPRVVPQEGLREKLEELQ
ncbi:MAG: hypothetical protein HYY16_19030 [Planctomycetes bacterium]|nr:hypothetical protein [Planctomycetota bacterium]